MPLPKENLKPRRLNNKNQYEDWAASSGKPRLVRQRLRPSWDMAKGDDARLLAKKAEYQAVVSGHVIQLLDKCLIHQFLHLQAWLF